MDIVMAGVRRNIPVKVTAQMRAAVSAYLAAPDPDDIYGSGDQVAAHLGIFRSDDQRAAHRAALTAVDCPRPQCRATAGVPCLNPQGRPMREKVHAVRVNRAGAVFYALLREAAG